MKRKCGYTEACFSLSFSFVSLDSFPFPPLKEAAAPTTHKDSFVFTKPNFKRCEEKRALLMFIVQQKRASIISDDMKEQIFTLYIFKVQHSRITTASQQ